MEESEVPACGVSFIAWVFERQRIHSGSLPGRMAIEASIAQHLHNSQ